jgi:RNA polymerase subunit RPABC4/transcription elongation factor Spt4
MSGAGSGAFMPDPRWKDATDLPSGFPTGAWDEDMPVPPDLGLTCLGCGEDLTGLDRRTCPRCGRAFNLPIPAYLNLTCRECGYALTGLTSRVCPECGTGFDVRGLLFARRVDPHRHRLRDRLPWHDALRWTLGVFLTLLGIVTLLVKFSPLLVVCIGGSVIIAARSYTRGAESSRVALWIGILWAVLGMLFLFV